MLDSAAEAKTVFAATRRADRARAKCGTTANATILGMTSALEASATLATP